MYLPKIDSSKLAVESSRKSIDIKPRLEGSKSKGDISLELKPTPGLLDPVRTGARETILKVELLKKVDELAKEKQQKQEAIMKIEAKYDGYAEFTKKQAEEVMVTLQNLKNCYKENKAEVKQLRHIVSEQNVQIAEYKAKYFKALQHVEEMKKQMDNMDMDNIRISEQINLEILNIKNNFRQKLRDLEPFPEKLKKAEEIIKQIKEEKAEVEHRADMLTKELQFAREKIHVLLNTMVEVPEKRSTDVYYEMSIAFLEQKIHATNNNCRKYKLEIERLKANLLRAENEVLQNELRLAGKIQECTLTGGELDRTRVEANDAIERMSKGFATTRKCLEVKVKDLELKLESANAQILSSEQEKQNLEQEMKARLNRMTERYDLAQHRTLVLLTELRDMKRRLALSGDDADGAGDGEDHSKCACRGSVFDNSTKPILVHKSEKN